MKTQKLVRFDWAIKTILRNKANFSILEGFLSELLKTDVKIKELLESESNKESVEDKSSRFDVLAQLNGGEKVIIEVQCAHQWDCLSRMLHSVSKVVEEHIKEEEYDTMPRVISVNIVYFDLGPSEDYIYHETTNFKGVHKQDVLQLSPTEKKHYPPRIDYISEIFPEYYVLKLSSFDLKIRNTLDEWMYALRESEVKPEFKEKGIQTAAKTLDILKLSDIERRRYERHIHDARVEPSVSQAYYSEGLAEGELKGKAEERKNFITSMHHSGLPMEQICKIAKLSQEEVQKIIESS